jgi:CelD/BcsL family acetyltransferase involved in cellulose biosynthesis
MEAAREDWRELEKQASASPYQTYAFARAWMETEGAALRATPLIAVARSPQGEVIALAPLCRFRRGPLSVAEFIGGRMANYQMGLFRDPENFGREDLEILLKSVAKQAALDLFLFRHQPFAWRGRPNPFATLPGRPSPSFAFATELVGDFETWTRLHYSTAARKKRRAKTRKLEALGLVSHVRAQSETERRDAIAAFLEQKRARMLELALPNEFDQPATRALVADLSGLEGSGGDAGFELHFVRAGERIVSVYAGLLRHGRLSGLLFSHDVAPEVSAASPGEFLIHGLVQDAYARGLESLDFGVGEARYKSEACEIVEPLFDSAFAATLMGRLGASLYLIARKAKRRIKQTPKLFDRARSVQRWLFRRRAR